MLQYIQQLDTAVLLSLVSVRNAPMNSLMEFASIFGEWYVVLPIAAIAVTILAKLRYKTEASELVYTVIGTSLAVVFIKALVGRPRPPETFRLVQEIGNSFPSWHAAIAVAFWGYLSFLAMRQMKHKTGRIVVAFFCAFLALSIGFSRLYLGVHYLSDVLGGYLFGLAALSLSVHFTRHLPKELL